MFRFPLQFALIYLKFVSDPFVLQSELGGTISVRQGNLDVCVASSVTE